jgi:hypothetical protein
MRLRLTALSGILFFLASCSKEISVENGSNAPGTGGGTGGGSNGTRLVRIGHRDGSDSLTTHYTYNSANLLSGISYSGSVAGQDVGVQSRIVRNASNIITSRVTKGALFLAIGIDSFISTYVYDAAQSRYRYSITSFTLLGFPVSDSAVFIYNGANRLASVIRYYDDGSGYEVDGKEELTYNGNNIATFKQYTHDGNNFELETTTTFEQYDTKINPLQFAADAVPLGMLQFYPANNLVKGTAIDHASGNSESDTIVYTYNTQNRPSKATSTQGAGTSAATYYYQ